MQYVSKKYPEEHGFHADCYQVVELDESVIRIDLDKGKWTKVMDGQWEIHPKKSAVSQKHAKIPCNSLIHNMCYSSLFLGN